MVSDPAPSGQIVRKQPQLHRPLWTDPEGSLERRGAIRRPESRVSAILLATVSQVTAIRELASRVLEGQLLATDAAGRAD
ncbi:hypothetical protein Psuf_087380 [Phytohabitans suffuscus]|uniref:Uncharacterized protein n=1 Tax=Phytohabitans suffuscus TaxID=624315 RepID=A0A6F8YZ26_9ACTN|nr:hypothetical protein Psuf_087380 [Phytohabitans suffuscus]